MAKTKKHVVRTQGEAAKFFDVSIHTLRDWCQSGMPCRPGRSGRPGTYDLCAIIRWLRSEGPWRPHAASESNMLDGPTSPALEEYRRAKADLAKLDLMQRKGDLIVRAECRELLWKWGDIIKRCRNRLFKNHGLAARQILDGAVDQCQKLLDREYGPEDEKPRP